jgi:hypothetical protein
MKSAMRRRVQRHRVVDRQRRVLRVHQQPDLGAAEDHAVGAGIAPVGDDREEVSRDARYATPRISSS